MAPKPAGSGAQNAREKKNAATPLKLDGNGKIPSQMRRALQKNLARVIDLFRQIDDDASGYIDGPEFVKAMGELGFKGDQPSVTALFASFDPNDSGTIEYRELHDLLVRSVQHKPELEPLQLTAANRIALRKKRISKVDANMFSSNHLRGTMKLDRVPGAIREMLDEHKARVVDLFRQFDDDSSGLLDFAEFNKAMSELGMKGVPIEAMAAVFASFDPDQSGTIEYRELFEAIKRSFKERPVLPPLPLRAANKIALRTKKIIKCNANLLGGLDLDEAALHSLPGQIKGAMQASLVRVVDLFRQFDDDRDGRISFDEFGKAMGELGLDVLPKALRLLFDEWDPDTSGYIEYEELYTLLRHAKVVEDAGRSADADGTAAAEFSIHAPKAAEEKAAAEKAATKVQAAKRGKDGRDEVHCTPTGDASSGATSKKLSATPLKLDGDGTIPSQMRRALQSCLSRVIELFRQFDDDASGYIDGPEFVKALAELGFDPDEPSVSALFASFDADDSGTIEYEELHNLLVRSVQHKPELEPLELKAANRIALRKKRVSKVDANLFSGLELGSLDTDAIPGAIRKALDERLVRVIDLFRQFDDDSSGLLDASEFAKAMRELGMADAPPEAIAAVFASFDHDESGTIEYRELHAIIKRSLQDRPVLAPLPLQTAHRITLSTKRVLKANANLLGGLDLDEAALHSLPGQIKGAMQASLVRVVDLFRQFDDDRDGRISFDEFGKAMGELGLDVLPKALRLLFDEWDPDTSGYIEYEELYTLLRHAKVVEDAGRSADADGTAAAEFSIHAPKAAEEKAAAEKAATKVQAAKRGKDGRDEVHCTPTGDASSGATSKKLSATPLKLDGDGTIPSQMRRALQSCLSRVIELFRQFDDDASGYIDGPEFVKALAELGFDPDEPSVSALFASFDADDSGTIEYEELHNLLVRSVQHKPELEPLELKAANRIALRKKRVSKVDANLFSGLELGSLHADAIPGAIRKALDKRLVRVIDLLTTTRRGCLTRPSLRRRCASSA